MLRGRPKSIFEHITQFPKITPEDGTIKSNSTNYMDKQLMIGERPPDR